MQTTLEKSPVGAGAGRKDIVAAAKSAGSEGPMSALDVSKRNVERRLADLETAHSTLSVVAGDDSKTHLVAGAKHERTMAYAELVACISDIVALHENGIEHELVHKAVDMIVNSTVEGKQNTNPLARMTARVLLPQINKSKGVSDILASDAHAIDDARAAISNLVSEAKGIIAEDPDGKNFRKKQELMQTLT